MTLFRIRNNLTITYNEKDTATSIEWRKKDGAEEQKQAFHGKYFLQSSLDESDADNIWEFYNVIRTVEETFKTLKSDLDIRPIYHKSDDGTKAHLNLAVLAYWIVSCVKYRLKQAKINVRWEELLRIMSTQVRVSVSAVRDNGNTITTRKSTEPEEKLTKIYDSLGISHKPKCSAKFVWHLKPPRKKNIRMVINTLNYVNIS